MATVHFDLGIDATQTTSALEAQWTATNYALRKRLHEMEQAKHELEWQKDNVS